jgi:hypothetical protein
VTVPNCCPPDQEFFVFEEDSRQLRFRWTEFQPIPEIVGDLVFSPLETKTLRGEWDQVTRAGEMIPAGAYEARGAIRFPDIRGDPLASGELASNLRSFTVR